MQTVHVKYKKQEIVLENINTYADIITRLGENPKSYYYALVDGVFVDLPSMVDKTNFRIEPMGKEGIDKNQTMWHSSAHIMAYAIKNIYPQALEAIGPVTSSGFFEDIDFGDYHLHPDDLPQILAEIENIIKQDYIIHKRELSKTEALEFFKDNPYKIANIAKIPDHEMITTYRIGDYEDLCRGPHLYSTGQIASFLLTNISSAYFQGNKDNKALQRVSGISFADEKERKKYENFMEEAKKRDHRKIGQDLELFSFHAEGPGFPFWHAKGTVLVNLLVDYLREQNTLRGYTEIKTPQALSDELWKKSGHYDNFKENMYFTDVDERSFALKPMNCPGGCLVYNSKMHSYRDLPVKQAEFGLVHRHELSGALHGLFRVRSFTQDDAHIFCSMEQLKTQIQETIQYVTDVYKYCGFEDISIFVSTRPDKSIGTDEEWHKATHALTDALDDLGLAYKIKDKEGAFYGPKIEFNIKDVLERNWQCGTVQVDFSMPARFNLSYEDSDGQSKTPIMIHRAIVGSLERFIGILIEHYAGKMPLWLAPVQVHIINVAEPHITYIQQLEQILTQSGLRVSIDIRNETLGYKIRHAKSLKTPFIAIIGDKEVQDQTLTIRDRTDNNTVYTMADFIQMINNHSTSS